MVVSERPECNCYNAPPANTLSRGSSRSQLNSTCAPDARPISQEGRRTVQVGCVTVECEMPSAKPKAFGVFVCETLCVRYVALRANFRDCVSVNNRSPPNSVEMLETSSGVWTMGLTHWR